MLLKKIRTKGFLGHLANDINDFVELDFADKNLWLIQGRNGAGKSTLFDAITMAFFKQHRGGASNFANLVHDKADKGEIFVEFGFHGNDYQIAVDIPKKSTVARRLQFWNGSDWATKDINVDDWVAQNLKMSYETFVSSVLLRQGEADKFIMAKPTPRREIFLELLQLEFYKKLTERAKFKHKCVSERLKEITQKLLGLDNHSDEVIINQQKIVEAFNTDLQNFELEKSIKQKVLDDSKLAQKFKNEIEEIESQQKIDSVLFENASQVEKRYYYFIELKENLSKIEGVWREKNDIDRAEKDFQTNKQKLADLENELKIVEDKLDKMLFEQSKAKDELQKSKDLISFTTIDRDSLKQKIDDIFRFENLELQIEQAEKELQIAQKDSAEKHRKFIEFEENIIQRTTQLEKLNSELQVIETNSQVWTDRLENRRSIVDKDECPTCGNELKHDETRRKLLLEFEEAEGKVNELRQIKFDLGENLTKSKHDLSVMNKEIKNIREEHQISLKKETEFRTQVETWKSQITNSYSTVERETYRQNFSKIQTELIELEQGRQKIKTAFEENRQEIVNLQNSKTRLESNLSAIQSNQENLQNLKQEMAHRLTKAETQVADKWKHHDALQNETALERLRFEKNEMQDIAAEHEKLSEARNREKLLADKKDWHSRQLEEIPETHRCDVLDAETTVKEIVEQIGIAKLQLNDAANMLNKMTEDKNRYDEQNNELKLVKADLEIWKKLVKALGKEGLETKVVKDAKQKIEDSANKTLAALSNGNFRLELTDSGKEMKILVRDFATGEQRQIEYFSGGEKFLTAVSLAVAIGQSASGQNIANTLIIDEGFGALDDKNRGLMVNELTRLGDILQNGRVIIVSHQDDVQENFANRFYLNRDENGLTNVQIGTNQ